MSEAAIEALLKLQSNLLTSEEAAAYIGVASNTLPVWRTTKRYALPYIKVGRLVKYRRSDLDAFLIAHTVAS